jgi:hypothetical protein
MGFVEKGMSITYDAEGHSYQRTFMDGNQWINVTLKEHNLDRRVYTHPASLQLGRYLPVQKVVNFLKVLLATSDNGDEVTLTTNIEANRYHLIIQIDHVEPHELGAPIPKAVIVSYRHFVFDLHDNNLLSDTHSFVLEDGEIFLSGTAHYELLPMESQLPEAVQQQFEEMSQIVKEEGE